MLFFLNKTSKYIDYLLVNCVKTDSSSMLKLIFFQCWIRRGRRKMGKSIFLERFTRTYKSERVIMRKQRNRLFSGYGRSFPWNLIISVISFPFQSFHGDKCLTIFQFFIFLVCLSRRIAFTFKLDFPKKVVSALMFG